jgi:hypothetical protein
VSWPTQRPDGSRRGLGVEVGGTPAPAGPDKGVEGVSGAGGYTRGAPPRLWRNYAGDLVVTFTTGRGDVVTDWAWRCAAPAREAVVHLQESLGGGPAGGAPPAARGGHSRAACGPVCTFGDW